MATEERSYRRWKRSLRVGLERLLEIIGRSTSSLT